MVKTMHTLINKTIYCCMRRKLDGYFSARRTRTLHKPQHILLTGTHPKSCDLLYQGCLTTATAPSFPRPCHSRSSRLAPRLTRHAPSIHRADRSQSVGALRVGKFMALHVLLRCKLYGTETWLAGKRSRS
jgi:hypothetical protein